jgi:hypothetical protein
MKSADLKELLEKVLPFMVTGDHECLVCGSREVPHEKDCFVPAIERAVGKVAEKMPSDRVGRVIQVNDLAIASCLDVTVLVRVTKVPQDGTVEVTANGLSFWNPLASNILVVDLDKLPKPVKVSR